MHWIYIARCNCRPVRTAAQAVQVSDFIGAQSSTLLTTDPREGTATVRLVEWLIKFAVVIFLVGLVIGFYLGLHAGLVPGHGG
jgi:hypothetical protein